MLIKVGYYFIANVILFLVFEKVGIVSAELNGPASVYAAAGLFSSANTLILFVLMSFFYNAYDNKLRWFLADILLTVIASIVPLLILQIGSFLFAPRLTFGEPTLPKLFTAWSITIPTVWIGWLACTFLNLKFKNGGQIDNDEEDQRGIGSAQTEITHPNSAVLPGINAIQQTILQGQTAPRWKRLYDFASLYLEEGNYQAAMPILTEVMSSLNQQTGVEPSLMVAVSTELGDCLADSGKYNAARKYYEQALIYLNRIPKDDGRKFAELVAKIGICYTKANEEPN